MKVSGDYPSLSLGERALPLHEVINAKLVTASFSGRIAIASIEDHSLIEANGFKDALCSDVTL